MGTLLPMSEEEGQNQACWESASPAAADAGTDCAAVAWKFGADRKGDAPAHLQRNSLR